MAALVFSSEFDWDSGNWPKCGKHGVSKAEIEQVFANNPQTERDPYPHENRRRAVGKGQAGRYVFIVYTERLVLGMAKIRPLSARYMHQKEIEAYEKRA